MLYMNVGTAGMESRTFQNIFSLSDPKERYPGIDKRGVVADSTGKVRLGMTKRNASFLLVIRPMSIPVMTGIPQLISGNIRMAHI